MGVLSVLVAVIPLLIVPHALFYYDVTPKAAVLLLGTAAFATWKFPHLDRSVRVLFGTRAGRLFVVLLIIQTVSIAAATIFSAAPAQSLLGSSWRRFGALPQFCILFWAAAGAALIAGEAVWVRRLLISISISGSLVSLFAVLQYFGWDPWLPQSRYHVGEGIWTIVRPPGTLGHADYLAVYLVYVAFAGAALALWPGMRYRASGAVAAALSTLATVMSGTRAGIVGICAGALLLVWCAGLLHTRRLRLAAMAVAVFAGVTGTAFYWSPYGAMLRARTRWFVEDRWGGGRLLLWRDSVPLIQHHWLAGAGLETFTSTFPRYQSEALAKVVPDAYYESPHNILVDAAASQGIPGLLVMLALCAAAWYAWRSIRESRPACAIGAGFAGALASQQFASFTVPTALLFYTFLAILVGLAAAKEAAGRAPAELGVVRPRWAAACLLAAALMYSGVCLLAADRQLAVTREMLDQGKVAEAAAAYARARAWESPGVNADLWYSRRMLEASRTAPVQFSVPVWRQAREAAIRAPQTAEDVQNAWYNLAMFYAAENKAAETEESLRKAIAAAPNWFKPHWVLARLLQAAGRIPEAREEAERAAALNGGDAEVARTLAEVRAAAGVR